MADCYIVRRGGMVESSLGFPEFTYTGNYSLLDDGLAEDGKTQNWRVKFLTSGTLTIHALGSGEKGVDVFLVGGGGNTSTYFAGAGAGHTKTQKKMVLAAEKEYKVVVGGSQGASSFDGLTADAGNPAYITGSGVNSTYYHGGDGGSGGASNEGTKLGGTDGGDGAGNNGGKGQGTTTREFGETNGTLYATGGNNGDRNDNNSRLANSGDGACGIQGTAYGKSGIVIIRNAR